MRNSAWPAFSLPLHPSERALYFKCKETFPLNEFRCILPSLVPLERRHQSMMIEFSVVPLGKGASLSDVIARVLKLVIDSGVRYKANPMGTVIEGEWGQLMDLIKKCHDEAMKDGDRVVTSIKIDDYKGKSDRLDKKLESVEQKLGKKLNR